MTPQEIEIDEIARRMIERYRSHKQAAEMAWMHHCDAHPIHKPRWKAIYERIKALNPAKGA